MNRIDTTRNIVDSVLNEMEFTGKEKRLFKDVIEVIKKNKESGNKNTTKEIMQRIEAK